MFKDDKKDSKKESSSGGGPGSPRGRADLWGGAGAPAGGAGGKGDEWGRRKEGLRKVSTRRKDCNFCFVIIADDYCMLL